MYSSKVQLRLVVGAGPVHQLRRPRRVLHDLAHKIAIKGLQNVEDAKRLADAGVDAIVLVGYGGRQLDRDRCPSTSCPKVIREVGDDVDVMIDTGIMNGADIVGSIAMGAKFTLVGRPKPLRHNPRLLADPQPYRRNPVLRGPCRLQVAFDGWRQRRGSVVTGSSSPDADRRAAETRGTTPLAADLVPRRRRPEGVVLGGRAR
jgi:hypothetical protein